MAFGFAGHINAHLLECVGLAANMIRKWKKTQRLSSEWEVKIWSCLIRFSLKGKALPNRRMLSLVGSRPTTRYEEISVAYRDMNWKAKKTIHLSGFPAQICQHEMDHLEHYYLKMKDGVDSLLFSSYGNFFS